MLTAGFIGIGLAGFWNFVLGIIIGVAVFLVFLVAAILRPGPGWTHDEDDDRHSWH